MCVIEARKGSENTSTGRTTRAAAQQQQSQQQESGGGTRQKFIFTFESINFYHLACRRVGERAYVVTRVRGIGRGEVRARV